MITGDRASRKWYGSGTVYELLETYKRSLVSGALEEARGNVYQAARILGIGANALQIWIYQLGLRERVQELRCSRRTSRPLVPKLQTGVKW